MAKTVTVEIPLVVGSNGKWSAYGYANAGDDIDWGLMSENLEGDDGEYPNAERRYVVRATVIAPDDAPEVVEGTLEA